MWSVTWQIFPRWFVGLVLIATGTGKILDIPGFVQVLAAYDLLPPKAMSPSPTSCRS